jgi:hypothetical protein
LGNIIQIPLYIEELFKKTQQEVQLIVEKTFAIQNTDFNDSFSLMYRHEANAPLLTDLERAQSICFITRYENLPELGPLHVVGVNGKCHLENMGFIRHILNEYRSIVLNERDFVFYNNVHLFCRKKLINKDPKIGLTIKAVTETGKDVTETVLKILDEFHKSIKVIIESSDFDYIYNGILQHSDPRFTNRFLDDYHSGKINYLLIKNASLLGYIKNVLQMHFKILNQLTFPRLGSL